VGEIGLDFYCQTLDQNRQRTLFEAQLAVAANAALPVLLHVRKSHDAVLACLRKTTVAGGICHAFNGSLQQAHQYIDLGFKLGFGGMLSFARSHKLHCLAQQLPLEAIVLETDAPDMTGAAHHGQPQQSRIFTRISSGISKTTPRRHSQNRRTNNSQCRSCAGFLPDKYMINNQDFAERFGGIQRLYGQAAADVIQQMHVCVIGLGGVGSWAVETLARTGVGQFTLIDYDTISKSNINRQLPALDTTLE